jgi:NADP-dependent 3-hydroxy acid dehydrogenase YdfG
MLLTSNMHGKVVAISGACSHAGASTARALASKGAMLMLGDRNLSELHALVARIAEEGGCAQYRAADPTRPASTEMLVAHTQDAYGRIDLLLSLGTQPRRMLAKQPCTGRPFAKPPAQSPIHPMHSLS